VTSLRSLPAYEPSQIVRAPPSMEQHPKQSQPFGVSGPQMSWQV